MKTFEHRKRTRERSAIPKRGKARAMKKAMRAAKRASNPRIVTFHF